GAGPVGAAEIAKPAIDDDGLEVHARALPQLEATTNQARQRIELLAKRPRGYARMQQSQLDAATGQLVEQLEHRREAITRTRAAARSFDQQLLEVRGRDPHAATSRPQSCDHDLVVPTPAEQRQLDRPRLEGEVGHTGTTG